MVNKNKNKKRRYQNGHVHRDFRIIIDTEDKLEIFYRDRKTGELGCKESEEVRVRIFTSKSHNRS